MKVLARARMCVAAMVIVLLLAAIALTATMPAERHGTLVIVRPGASRYPSGTALQMPPHMNGFAPAAYQPLIASLANQYGVDPALIQAIIFAESSFDRYAVSSQGAQGLMQLMPVTAARFAVRDAFDPVENIRGGIQYVRFLSDLFTNQLALILAAYNAGEGAVIRHQGIPPYAETQAYVERVLAYYRWSKSAVFPSAAQRATENKQR
jgi:soluble lytic murein transglycosylase-like protein